MFRVISKPFAAMDIVPILQAVINAQKENEVDSPTDGIVGEDEDSTSTDREKPVGHSCHERSSPAFGLWANGKPQKVQGW